MRELHAAASKPRLMVAIPLTSAPPSPSKDEHRLQASALETPETHHQELMQAWSRTRQLRRHRTLAKGLARNYPEQRAKEEVLTSKQSRHNVQLAMLQALHSQKKAEADSADTLKNDKERDTQVIAPAQGLGGRFPRHTSLRQQANDLHDEDGRDDDEKDSGSPMDSPTNNDIERFAALLRPQETVGGPTSPTVFDLSKVGGAKSAKKAKASPEQDAVKGPAAPASTSKLYSTLPLDRTTSQALCELRIMKEIVIREQTIKQLRHIIPLINSIAQDLSEIAEQQKKADAAPSSGPIPSLLRRGSTVSVLVPQASMRRPLSSQNINAAASEAKLAALIAQSKDLIAKASSRLRQLVPLVVTLRDATMNAVESILQWRQLRQRRCRFTNAQPLYRFPWKPRRVRNYLMHMAIDLQSLFPSPALAFWLGPDIRYNPLLLPTEMLQALDLEVSTFVSTTFLTERTETIPSLHVGSRSLIGLGATQPSFDALKAAIHDGELMTLRSYIELEDPERARSCLEALQQELELERLDAQAKLEELARKHDAYDPFTTIKASGGIDATLMNLLVDRPPEMTEQLRCRQEDTTRAGAVIVTHSEAEEDEKSESVVLLHRHQRHERLRVNAKRLRDMVDKRNEQERSSSECEVRSIPCWGMKNKLPGQMMVRKLNARRVENQNARKIQLQFRAHQRRRSILSNLSSFVIEARLSIVNIQRIARGFRAKQQIQLEKERVAYELRRHEAARCIYHSFRRYKRRLRHRRSMTVEAIAQAQLVTIQYQKLQELDGEGEGDAVDRYRRVGEERRRQRIVLLERKKLEQLAQEYRRIEAAVRIQALFRGHLGRCAAIRARKDRKAHMTAVSAMCIQSKIRTFLKNQEKRRLRFRQDLERVNRSAVRIQSIYRGYNSRATLLSQLDTYLASAKPSDRHRDAVKDAKDDDEDDEEDDQDRLPPLARPLSSHSRPSSSSSRPSPPTEAATPKLSLPSIRPRPVSPVVVANPPRRPSFVRSSSSSSSASMGRTELKLKEPVIGDDF